MGTLQKIEQIKMHTVTDHSKTFSDLFFVRLPSQLQSLYGGDLKFLYDPHQSDIPLIHINFVMSKEGIFNLRDNPGGGPISQGNRADPFVMALLRAHADAVMVGAETLRREGSAHVWNYQFIFDVFPQMQGLDGLRRQIENFRTALDKHNVHPPTFFMTNSGKVNPDAEVFKREDIQKYIVTGARGAQVAMELLARARNTQVLSFGDDELDEVAMLRYLKQKLGVNFLLHEGGRGAVASLARHGLVAEFFLTHMHVSPEGNTDKENAQYLFETHDHMPPLEAHLIEKRIDATENASFLNLDFRNVRSM